MEKSKNESIKRKLYKTLHRLGVVAPLDPQYHHNIYIDDSGYVMILMPDGVISSKGKLSICGEFICPAE